MQKNTIYQGYNHPSAQKLYLTHTNTHFKDKTPYRRNMEFFYSIYEKREKIHRMNININKNRYKNRKTRSMKDVQGKHHK